MYNTLERYLQTVVNAVWNYAGRSKTYEDHLMNATLGLVGEAGEVADIVKKMQFHTEKPFEHFRPQLVLELGDVLFYYMKFLEIVGITLEEVIEYNKYKLSSRHPELGEVSERFPEGYIR